MKQILNPNWTACKNDGIGKISQIVSDFIEVTRGYLKLLADLWIESVDKHNEVICKQNLNS